MPGFYHPPEGNEFHKRAPRIPLRQTIYSLKEKSLFFSSPIQILESAIGSSPNSLLQQHGGGGTSDGDDESASELDHTSGVFRLVSRLNNGDGGVRRRRSSIGGLVGRNVDGGGSGDGSRRRRRGEAWGAHGGGVDARESDGLVDGSGAGAGGGGGGLCKSEEGERGEDESLELHFD